MATERVIIEFQSRGLRTVTRNMGKLRKEASNVNRTLALLRSTLVVVAGARVIGRFLELADTLTNIRNRLRLATQSTAELNAVQNELFKISQRTQSSFEGNAELFQRLTLATNGLSLSYADLLTVTEAVANALRISGATAQEAAGSTRQFTQALGAGAAQGEELRGLVEGNVRLAESIAKQFKVTGTETAAALGVTNKELDDATQKLGRLGAGGLIAFNKINSGAIKTEIIVKGLLADADQLRKEALSIDRTVSGAFTRFNNSLTIFIGGLSNSIKLGEKLDTVLQGIAKNFALIGISIAAIAGLAIFNLLVSQVLNFGRTAGGVLNFLFSGFRGLAILIGKGLVVAFRLATGAASLFGKVLRSGLIPIIILIAGIVAAFFALKFAIQSVVGESSNLGKTLKTAIGSFVGFAKAVVTNFSKLPAALGDLGVQAINSLIDGFETGLNRLKTLITSVTGIELKPTELDRVKNAFAGTADAVAESFSKSIAEGAATGFDDTVKFGTDAFEKISTQVKKLFAGGLLPADFDQAKILARTAGTGEAIARLNANAKKAETAFLRLRGQVDPLAAGLTKLQKAATVLAARFGKNFQQNKEAAKTFRLVALEVLGLENAEFKLQQRLKLVDDVNKQVKLSTDQLTIARNKARLEANQEFAATFGAISPLIAARQTQLQIETSILENRKQLAAAGLSAAEAEKRLLRESLGLPKTLAQTNEQIELLVKNQKKLGLSSAELAFETRKLKLEQLDQQRTLAAGTERFFVRLTQDATDAATQIETVLGQAFEGATDAIVEFVQTGKFELGDLANEIQTGLLKFAIQGLIADFGGLLFPSAQRGGGEGILGSLFGGLGGSGGLTGLGSLIGAQNGADFQVNSNSAVASIPGIDNRLIALRAKDGENVKVTPKGQGGQAPIVLTVNVNASGSTASAQEIGVAAGQAATDALQTAQRAQTRNG